MAHLACLALLTGKNPSLSPGSGGRLWRPLEEALENWLPSQSLTSTQASTDVAQVFALSMVHVDGYEPWHCAGGLALQ